MRHMRSRRILAMLLALSMIFGLLTTTAFAGEVDQNTSNVGESAANGTSEGGSSEGQSSGASEDESSKVTNKEDVPTEEETNPEQKKTTSSEEVDTQEGEGKTPVEETTYVASIGEQGYASLDAAIQAAVDGDTVTLLGNVELTETLTISSKDITLDVGSNTLTVSTSSDGIVVENATLTLASSGSGKYVFNCSARGSDGIYVNNTDASTTSTLNLNGDVEINVQASVNSAIHAVASSGNAVINIKDGKITATGSGKQFKAIHVDQNATLNMAGGELDITVDFDTYSENNDVVGVCIYGNSSKQENCHVVISDGIFKVGGKNAFAQVVQVGMVNGYSENCNVSITGGTVELTPSESGTGYVYTAYKPTYATATISGGTVSGNVTALTNTAVPVDSIANDGLTVTGGRFTNISADEMSKYLSEGTTYDEATGTVTSGSSELTAYVTVNGGEKKYATLAEAVAAAEPDADGVITYAISGKVEVDGTGWIQVVKPNQTEVKTVKFVGEGEGAEICITGGLAILADQPNDVDVSFDSLILSKPNPAYGGDYGHSTNYFTCWLRNTNAAENTVTYTNCTFPNGACNNQYGKTVYNNCNFTNDTTGKYNLWVYGGDVKLNGGEFTGVRGAKVYTEGWPEKTPTVEVKDTKFTGLSEKAAIVVSKPTSVTLENVSVSNCTAGMLQKDINDVTDSEKVTIEANGTGIGGTIELKSTTATDSAKDEFFISAGSFDQAISDDYAADGKKFEQNADGSYGVTDAPTTTGDGTEAKPYTLAQLGAMTRDEYITAQKRLNGTMYVTVGDYSYGKDGVLGNGKRDDTPGQTEDRSVLNGYNSNGYLGEKNDGANGLNIVFVNGSITSSVTGYTSIDKIGTSLLLAVPAYTNVTFKGITFKNVMCFNYQLYTGPWSQLGELKFDGCTFNGIIVGATAAQTLTFNSCTFNNYTNTTDANSSNPTWIRPAYGNWKESDNDGQGPNFQSLTTINFTNNTVTSTRPVKFEFISQWNKTTTLTATGNSFDISAQESDTETKNVGLYIGPHTDKNAVNLVLDHNTKSEGTAALYVIPSGMSKLPVGSTVKDSSGTEIEITDALEWKTDTKVTLKTETVPAVKNVAKVGDTEYATLEEAIANAVAGQTVTLITDVNTPEKTYVVSKNLTIDLNGKTVTGSGYDGVFQIDGANAKVLIENGNVVAVEQSGTAGKYAMAVWACAENCELTLEGLTVTQDIAHTDDKQMDMIYTSKGTIIINSGSFTSGTPAWTLNCKDAAFKDGSAKIIVNGGEFVGFDPRNNKAEGTGTSFVADGVGVDYGAETSTFTAKANMTAQLLDASGNSVKAYTSLADAIAAAEAGQTVTLLDNVTDNIEIATDKNFTLDLNGHTINGGTGTAKATITNYGTVTITDSSTAKTGTIKRDDSGTVGETSYYVIRNIGTMTIEQANVTNNSGYRKTNPSGSMVGSSLICNGDDDLGGTLNISGGTFEQKNFIAIKNGALGKLNVTGGTISSDHSAIQNWFEATITGGEINGQLWTDAYKEGESVGHTTIGGNAKYTGEIVMDIAGSVKPTLEISGGTLDVTNWRITTAASKAGAKPAVSGGTFTKAVSADYCAEGFEPKDNGDGTFGVKEISAAKIGNVEYETLAAAFAAAKDGETIVLLKNSSGNGIVVETGTFTDKGLIVDFNNRSYTVGGVLVGSSGTASNGFQLNKDNKITFKNGALYGDASVAGDKTTNWTGAPAIMIQNYSNLTLEKMTVVGGKETCYTISNNCGDTLIKNSTITAGEASTKPAYQPARAFDVCGFSTYPGATVTVENSTINGAVEISNGNNSKVALTIGKGTAVSGSLVDGGNGDKVTVTKDKSVDVTAPDGYKWVDGEAGQTLAKIVMVAEVNGKQYETLQAAIDAAIRNQTVKLIADTTENVTMETPYLTLDLNGHTLNGGQVKGTPALTVTARVTVMDSSAEQTGTIKREDTAENSGVSSHYVIDIQGGGWLTFESGNVTNDSGVVGVKGASLVRVGDDSVAKYPGLNIKGGSFRQDNFIAIKVDRGDLFLNGGTITSENSYAIENWFRTTIKGGIVNGTVASWTYSGGSNSTTTITGGTINGNVASVTYDKSEGKKASVSITGGTVTGTLGTYSYNNGLVPLQDSAKATIGVTGGTFDIDPTPYVVEGSTVKKNSEGKYGVEKAYLCQIGETKYYTMDEAFKAQTTSGEAIVLLRDYTTGSSFKSGSINRTVDLNNYTWTYTGTDTNCAAFEVNNSNVSLTVKNGKVVSNSMVGLIPSAMGGTITYDNSGLVFENVQATANGNSGIETNGNNTNDTVTLKDSTLNVPNGFGIYFPSSGTLTIDNSKITAKTLGVQVCSGSLDIKGQNAAITVNGDPVPKTENDGAIQDGAAISIVNRAGYKGLDKITVTEGTFKAKEGNAAVKAYNWANQAESDFTESNKVAISGGTFSSAVAPEYCAEGFEPKDNGDGTYGVQPDGNVAEIGSMKYKSLDEALKAAKDGETVKLLKDAELEEVVIRSGRTLDLNGHTLKADYVTYFGGNLVDNSAAHTGLLKVLSADEILFTKNKKIDAMTQIPIYSLEKQGYVFEEIVLRVAPVTNKTPGALQAVYRPRQKDGKTDLSDAQKAMFGSANGHPVTATFRLVYKYKNSNEVQTFEFDFVDTYMDIYLNQNLYMYVTVTGLNIANIETITVTPVLKSAGGQVELVGKTIDTAAVLANLIGQ